MTDTLPGVPNVLASSRGGPVVGGAPNPLPGSRITGTPVPGAPNVLPATRLIPLPATTLQTFSYDDAGRLKQEERTGAPTTSWTYDDAGNRTGQTTGGQTTTYSYDADNRLLTSSIPGGVTTTFSYDANGSMVERAGPGETLAYGWDTAGRLTGITRNGSSQAAFAYDGDGNRRSKTSGSQTTSYVNDARGLSQVLQATTGSSTVSYVPGIGQHDTSKPSETTKWGYSLSDTQNVRLLVDGAGVLAHRWEWEPFGRARAESGSTAAAFGYGGEQRDDETGLINLRARYYDPGIGRFLSRDTLPGALTVPQSWNRYSYTENDPINATDPSGHKKKQKKQKIKWPMGMDPDDDSHAKKKAKACKNPGQYTGSCKGGPPNAAYAADGEAQHEAKKAGQAASSGNLAAASAHLQAAAHFASIAGTAAASTATLQAYASVLAAVNSIQAAHPIDNPNGAGTFSAAALSVCGGHPLVVFTCHALIHAGVHVALESLLHNPELPAPPPKELMFDKDGLPIYFIDAARMENIAINAYEAQLADPSLVVLTYLGPKSPQTILNRRAACKDHIGPGSCEEYPFASTVEGGSGARIRGVPVEEQKRQGGDVNNFYTHKAKLTAGDRFRVIVWFAVEHESP
jgi:RHS repeat-associated protein